VTERPASASVRVSVPGGTGLEEGAGVGVRGEGVGGGTEAGVAGLALTAVADPLPAGVMTPGEAVSP